MKNLDTNTENKILESAKKVFNEKGYDGARMQEIADLAGINKALLHYYYRSKDKLFKNVFEQTLQSFFPIIAEIILSNKPLLERIKLFIDKYIDVLIENPIIPLFIANEVAKNPLIIKDMLIPDIDNLFSGLNDMIDDEVSKGNFKKVDIKQLILNIISLCIFPFISQSIAKMIFNYSDEEYKELMLSRKNEIYSLILAWLKP